MEKDIVSAMREARRNTVSELAEINEALKGLGYEFKVWHTSENKIIYKKGRFTVRVSIKED